MPQETGPTDARDAPNSGDDDDDDDSFYAPRVGKPAQGGHHVKIVQVTISEEVHTTLKEAARTGRIAMAEVIRQVLAQWAARRTRKGGAS